MDRVPVDPLVASISFVDCVFVGYVVLYYLEIEKVE
jgi:hypothetical protein